LEHELEADTPIEEITYDRIMGLVTEMRKAGAAEGTVKRKLDPLNTALGWSVRRGKLSAKPLFPKIVLRNMKDRFLSADEEETAFAFITEQRSTSSNRDWWLFKCLITFLIDSGARLGEACEVRAVNIQDGRVSFHCYQTKTDKPRGVPLSERVLSQAPTLAQSLPDGRLFGLTRDKAWRYWREVSDVIPSLDDTDLDILRPNFPAWRVWLLPSPLS